MIKKHEIKNINKENTWLKNMHTLYMMREYAYEQFSLQPAHPCFKIDHVGSSGKFSYMFPVYMVITSKNKKIIWKVVFKIIDLFRKDTSIIQTFLWA